MRIIKKKKDKGKAQYTEQSEEKEVKDSRYSIKRTPIFRKSKLEDMDKRPDMEKNTGKKNMKFLGKSIHKKGYSATPPDAELAKEYPPENTRKMGKDKKKKMSALIISKKMKKR